MALRASELAANLPDLGRAFGHGELRPAWRYQVKDAKGRPVIRTADSALPAQGRQLPVEIAASAGTKCAVSFQQPYSCTMLGAGAQRKRSRLGQ
jgi:hypothetical protein